MNQTENKLVNDCLNEEETYAEGSLEHWFIKSKFIDKQNKHLEIDPYIKRFIVMLFKAASLNSIGKLSSWFMFNKFIGSFTPNSKIKTIKFDDYILYIYYTGILHNTYILSFNLEKILKEKAEILIKEKAK